MEHMSLAIPRPMQGNFHFQEPTETEPLEGDWALSPTTSWELANTVRNEDGEGRQILLCYASLRKPWLFEL